MTSHCQAQRQREQGRDAAELARRPLPSVTEAVSVCIAAGAPGITVHPRLMPGTSRQPMCATSPAQLRTRPSGIEFNIEGDPRPDLLALVHEVRPDQCTLVPVREGEITSQAGLAADHARVGAAGDGRAHCRRARFASASSSIPTWTPCDGRRRSTPTVSSSTPSRTPSAFAAAAANARKASRRYAAAATLAHSLGLGINAGHDLDLDNLTLFRTLPHLDEVSIGHALISHALYVGLETAVRDYLRVLAV